MLFVACSSDDDKAIKTSSVPATPSNNQMSFSAGIENDNTTRTSTSDNGDDTWSTVWSANESIDIYNVLNSNASGVFSTTEDSEGQEVASFTGGQIANQGEGGNKFYALYPSGTTFNPSNKQMQAELPIIQPAYDDGINPAYQFMTACSNTNSLSFKNVCALVKIDIEPPSDFSIGVIKIVSNNGEKIAGDFTATINDNGTTTVTNATSTFVEIRKTADGDGQEPLAKGTYYIAVLTTVLSKGFTLYLEDVEHNKVYQRIANTKNGYEFKRSEVTDLGSYSSSNYGNKILSNVVDLGLPSGTLWATKNIAAGDNNLFVEHVYDYGQYYCWAEDFGYDETPKSGGTNTADSYTRTWVGVLLVGQYYYTKIQYEWNTYKWQNGTTAPEVKVSGAIVYSYRDLGKYKPSDNKTVMDDSDDIAHIKSQGKYKIPTSEQFVELGNTSSYVTINARAAYTGTSNNGYKITSKIPGYTSRTMWLPAAGICYGALFDGGDFLSKDAHKKNVGTNGYYWSNTIDTSNESHYHYAYCFDIESNTVKSNNSDRRYAGRSIRAVVSR